MQTSIIILLLVAVSVALALPVAEDLDDSFLKSKIGREKRGAKHPQSRPNPRPQAPIFYAGLPVKSETHYALFNH